MPFRVIGNNTSFTFTSFNTGTVVTSFLWNSLVATNLSNMKKVTDRFPVLYKADVLGTTNSAGAGSWVGTTAKTRHSSLRVSWYQLPNFTDSVGANRYHIYPKNIATGPTVLNTIANYFVFYTPGIYNIDINIKYTLTTAVPTMLRMAIVPYTNNGVNYQIYPPFDAPTTFSNNTDGMANFLLAYTGKLDDSVYSNETINLSGIVLVTSQTLSNAAGKSNIAINNTNPLTPGNAYHVEIEGMYANATDYATNPRFTITGGSMQITLLQEWWS
jgi:hypothetical protein